MLRRTQNSKSTGKDNKICFKDIEINLETYGVSVGNEIVTLSKHEFDILKLLMEYPNKVFTKNNLYETVWDNEFIGDDNTINVYISRIRSKLIKVNPNEEYIQTVWGIGFKMKT